MLSHSDYLKFNKQKHLEKRRITQTFFFSPNYNYYYFIYLYQKIKTIKHYEKGKNTFFCLIPFLF